MRHFSAITAVFAGVFSLIATSESRPDHMQGNKIPVGMA